MLRQILIVLSALLLAASASAQVTKPLMNAGFIGPVDHTMSERDVVGLGLSYERTEGPSEGGDVVVYDVHLDQQTVVTVVFDTDGAQQNTTTQSRRFETPEGARIGDTLAQLRALYPYGVVSKALAEGAHLSFSPFPFRESGSRAVFTLDVQGLSLECFLEDKNCPDLGDRRSEAFETWDWPRFVR